MNIFQPDMKQNIYAYEMTAADRFCWQEGIDVFAKKSWYEDYKAKRKSGESNAFWKWEDSYQKVANQVKQKTIYMWQVGDCHSEEEAVC